MDVSKLSDAELDKMLAEAEPTALDPSKLSDAELDAAIAEADAPPAKPVDVQNPLERMKETKREILDPFILDPLKALGSKVDQYTGAASTRAGLGALLDGESPLGAAKKQYSEPSETAPTGKELAMKVGLSDEEYIPTGFTGLTGESLKVSPAGVAGFVGDVALDPTNILGATSLFKGAAKGVGKGAVMGAKAVEGGAHALDVATGLKIGEKTINTAKKAKQAADTALSALFVPKRAEDYKELAAIAAKNGIDPGILPEGVEFGPSSVITRLSRVKAEGPTGQQALERYGQAYGEVQRATERKVSDDAFAPGRRGDDPRPLRRKDR
jgi:hypothetical protein